jgi:hypothetical protein
MHYNLRYEKVTSHRLHEIEGHYIIKLKEYTLEKTAAIKNGQSRETGNIGYTGHRTKTDTKIPHRNLKR